MKSILLSINPEWVAKILNGEKTIEIRKEFPEDYVGWVYVYCTKEKIDNVISLARLFPNSTLNEIQGKVVARFWCDKVEDIRFDLDNTYFDNYYYISSMNEPTVCRKSCLTKEQLYNYLGQKNGYAIHISKLEIFDRPRELSEFNVYCEHKPNCWTARCRNCPHLWSNDDNYCVKQLTKAPQNYCYLEVEE